MDVADHIGQLRRDGVLLAGAASSVEPAAPVPTCPDWSVRDLVRHIGGVHRWATGFLGGDGRQPREGDLEQLVGGWPQDADLVPWFRAGHADLLDALAAAPADLEAWTFLDAPTPLAFWARRQAHETAIHRVDAEGAAGVVTAFPPAFAADGIDELLLRFANRPGRELQVQSRRSLLVRATDVARSWRITFTPRGFRNRADPDEADAEAELVGTASDLYVALWNRRNTDGLTNAGGSDLIALWKDSVRVRWT